MELNNTNCKLGPEVIQFLNERLGPLLQSQSHILNEVLLVVCINDEVQPIYGYTVRNRSSKTPLSMNDIKTALEEALLSLTDECFLTDADGESFDASLKLSQLTRLSGEQVYYVMLFNHIGESLDSLKDKIDNSPEDIYRNVIFPLVRDLFGLYCLSDSYREI
jgi:hypothetical protein